jgi:tetratricopeptide (TPR) repeat protein
MNKKRFLLVIKASDIGIPFSPEDNDAYKEAVRNYFLKNYSESAKNIAVEVHNDIITIEWIPEEKDDNIEAELENSIRLLSDGKLEDARFILEDLAFQSPKDPNVLYNLGMCYSDLNDLDIAVDTLNGCVKIAPLYSNAHVALGVAYVRQGKLQQALIQFTEAIELDKNNSFAYRNLATIFGKMNDNVNALKYLKLAFDIDPADPHTLYGLGLIYQDLGDNVNATTYFKKLIELGVPQELIDLAKDRLREIAVSAVKEGGFRADAMLYCISAMEKFEKMNRDDIQKIAYEIGMKGADGIDINDPLKRYTLKSMHGEYTGLKLICYMYVGFKIIDPTVNTGIDLSREFNMAKQMFRRGGQIWN